MNELEYTRQRERMVEWQIRERGIHSQDVLDAFLQVRRHVFVTEPYRNRSYEDCPLSIGFNQTVSQPYIVAFMTEMLKPDKSKRALEIGTGSGYQTAILSCLCKEVYSIEILPDLAKRAQEILMEEGYHNINLRIGDGYSGWKEAAPFDIIIVTCAPERIPAPLLDQLAEGGTMMIPAGKKNIQLLYRIKKNNGKITRKEIIRVIFVPMIHDD
jgi:protein-L-isoaspartate(D-aspartate) O-methyltransferase